MSKKTKTVRVLAPHNRTGTLGEIRTLDATIADKWIAAGLVEEVKTKPAKGKTNVAD